MFIELDTKYNLTNKIHINLGIINITFCAYRQYNTFDRHIYIFFKL